MFRSFSGLRYLGSFSGTADLTNQVCPLSNNICVFNDGGSDVVVTVNGMSWTVKVGDLPFDEYFEPFSKFSITATTDFRVIVRG